MCSHVLMGCGVVSLCTCVIPRKPQMTLSTHCPPMDSRLTPLWMAPAGVLLQLPCTRAVMCATRCDARRVAIEGEIQRLVVVRDRRGRERAEGPCAVARERRLLVALERIAHILLLSLRGPRDEEYGQDDTGADAREVLRVEKAAHAAGSDVGAETSWPSISATNWSKR